MRCSKARRFMMDQLYESLSEHDSKALQNHLDSCPSCTAEWEAVNSAHSWMTSVPDDAVPLPLEQKVLHQVHSSPHVSEPGSTPFGWRRWAVAASFLVIAFTSYHVWQSIPPAPRLDATHSDTMQSLELVPESLEQQKQVDKTSVAQIRSVPLQSQPVVSRNSAVTSQDTERSQLQMVPAVIKKETVPHPEAQELFQTGLRNYNNAFTKTGQDRSTLLRSAIITLHDITARFPDEKEWVAMSMILIADAHRELNEPAQAIQTYQRMIDQYPDQPAYTRQARASILKLLLSQEDTAIQAGPILAAYSQQQPRTTELATFAMAYSEKIQAGSPTEALQWYQTIRRRLPVNHPLYQTASNRSAQIEQTVRDQYYIRDWDIVGPLPLETLPVGDQEDSFHALLGNVNSEVPILQTDTHTNKTLMINLATLFGRWQPRMSAFAHTRIQSPRKQTVLLHLGFSNGIRVWLNNDPISSGIEGRKYRRDSYVISGKLKPGWNSLLLKIYHTENNDDWKFSVLITDPEGHLINDLHYKTGTALR